MVVAGLGLVLLVGRWIPLAGSVMVGLFAALTGGAVVSLLRQQRPAVITPGAPYAVLALIGVLLYLALIPVDGGLAAFACVGFVVIARFVTLHRGTTTGAVSSLPEP